MGHIRRLKRYLSLVGWLVLASLIPPAFFLGIVYFEEIHSAKRDLRHATELGVRRIDTVLNNGNQLLEEVAQIDVTAPQAEETLRRLEYSSALFREIGIVDEQGFLVFTSFGPVSPPIPIKAEHRADAQRAAIQILGPTKTAVMQEESLIVSLPTQGLGEVNALVDPVILTDPWGCLVPAYLGNDGFFAYIDMVTGEVLAGQGEVPPLEVLQQPEDTSRIRFTQTSQNGEVLVVGEVSKIWVLHTWRRLLLIGVPITAICSGVLVVLTMRLVQRSEGLDRELMLGLENHELVIHYQPIMYLPTETCVGSEALLRWHHPQQGLLGPGLFIPIAEKTGLINQISEWLIRQIAQEQASLYEQLPNLYTAINVSPHQVHSGGLEKLLAWLQDTTLCAPNRFVFEVTETTSVLAKQETTAVDTLARLRNTGARIALDDFGQGYSGLSYLHQLDVDVLNIDQLYVSAIGKDPQLTSILESIIELGNKFNFTLVAEGIETSAQLQFLQDHGVVYGQGWLFSRPLPIQEFSQFLSTSQNDFEEP